MSVASVNPYLSMMSAYKAASDNKQTNNLLDTVETTQSSTTTRPGDDTVTISQEASRKSRLEQYPLKDDPVELFNKWLEEGSDVPYFSLGGTGMNGYTPRKILPENEVLLSELRQKAQQETDPEAKRTYMFKISVLDGLGASEMFKTESDIDARVLAENQSLYLKQQYLTEKYGNPNGAMDSGFMQRAEQAISQLRSNALPSLSGDTPKAPEQSFIKQGFDLDDFNNPSFLTNLIEKAFSQKASLL